MKVTQIGTESCGIVEVETGDFFNPEKVRVLVSFQTVVGYIKDNKRGVTFTGERISRTTSHHINLFKRFYGEGRVLDGEAFAEKLAKIGLSSERDGASISF